MLLQKYNGLNKKQINEVRHLIQKLGLTTEAEKLTLIHIYKRDGKDILIQNYKQIKENNGWVKIVLYTNKASLDFSVLASDIEKDDYRELWNKIE